MASIKELNDVLDQTTEVIQPTEPKKYKVIFHNDEKTTFEFVIIALVSIFHKTPEQALDLTQVIHQSGAGIAGIYTKEVAEMKTLETLELASSHGFPLKVTYEEF